MKRRRVVASMAAQFLLQRRPAISSTAHYLTLADSDTMLIFERKSSLCIYDAVIKRLYNLYRYNEGLITTY